MKTKRIILCCMALFMIMAGIKAQGVHIYKSNGERITLLNAEVDSIVAFEKYDGPSIPNGHEAVDLGLSVKWATCNVGANKPEEYGNYYAWGETSTKSDYSSSTSTTYGKTVSQLKSSGILDNNGNLTSNYDAARKNWGGTWRMPTKAEIQELKDNCTTTWTTQNGVYGRKVTSKKNGNSIFLPAAGYRNGSSLYSGGSNGLYWSSSPSESNTYYAYRLGFYSGDFDLYYDYRYYGLSVRPVTE